VAKRRATPVTTMLGEEMGTQQDMQELSRLLETGEIAKASRADLEKYMLLLSSSQAYSHFGDRQFLQVCETVRLLLFKKDIDALAEEADKSAKKTEKLTGRILFLTWVIVALTAVLVLTVFVEFPKITIKKDQQPNLSAEKTIKEDAQANVPNLSVRGKAVPSVSEH
jgi:hypothetical protein